MFNQLTNGCTIGIISFPVDETQNPLGNDEIKKIRLDDLPQHKQWIARIINRTIGVEGHSATSTWNRIFIAICSDKHLHGLQNRRLVRRV